MVRPVNWTNVPNLTKNLRNFGTQFNVRYLKRDGASDGAWGDEAHRLRRSGHNPDDTSGSLPEFEDADKVPEIRAIDVDKTLNDPTSNFQDVVNHLISLPKIDTQFRYIIYNHKIYHVNNDFKPVAYTGSDPHTEHGHLSGAWSDKADNDGSFDFQLEKVGKPAVAAVPLLSKNDTGETVVYWQYVHNVVRNMFTPPLPALTIDGIYGPSMAAGFVEMWKRVGTPGDFKGDFLPGWLALKYQQTLAKVSVPTVSPIDADAATVIKNTVEQWLVNNVVGLDVNVAGTGKVIIK